jgi:catecholate siderophore receptor
MRTILIIKRRKAMHLQAMPVPPIRPKAIPATLHVLFIGLMASSMPGHAQQARPLDRGSVASLPEVTVVGEPEPAYLVTASTTATKTDTLLRDTPQSLTVLSKELLRDQGALSMADLLRYVPGVVPAQGEGNRDTAVFRGNNTTGDFFVDGIRDDVQYYRDFYNIETVEVLKGPNAMIFGRGGSGGVINRSSKVPNWSDTGDVSLTLGAWQQRRMTADMGRAINQGMAWRVNAMVEDAGSYRNGVGLTRSGINPTLALRAGGRTGIVLGYEHFKDERVADRGIPSFQERPYDTAASTYFGDAANSPVSVRVDALSGLVEHRMDHGVMLRNRTRYAEYDKFYQNVVPGAVRASDATVSLSAYNNASQRSNFFNQSDLLLTVDAGPVRHRIATGIELGRQVTDNLRKTGYFLAVGPNATSISVPLANAMATSTATYRPASADANNHGVATVAAAYLQDQLELTDAWQAIVGLRYDRFHVALADQRINTSHPAVSHVAVTDRPLSPRFGLLYKPAEHASIYGSYSIAFAPRAGDQLSSLTPSNKAFDPEKSTNLELGAKWDIRPELAATAAAYRLQRSNVLVTDGTNPQLQYLVDGQRTKGVELGLTGQFTANWSMTGGYAFQDAMVRGIPGSAPATSKDVVQAQVPRNTLSLWNRIEFAPGRAGALGMIYRGSVYTSIGNTVSLPAFTRVDGAMYYSLGKRYRLQLNVENVLDRKYYALANSDNNITPGSGRAVRLTLDMRL